MRLGWPTLYGQKHRARPTPIVNPFPQKFFLAHSCMFKKTSSNDGRRVCVEANQVQRTLAGETAARASGRGARGDVGCAGGTTGGPLGRGGLPRRHACGSTAPAGTAPPRGSGRLPGRGDRRCLAPRPGMVGRARRRRAPGEPPARTGAGGAQLARGRRRAAGAAARRGNGEGGERARRALSGGTARPKRGVACPKRRGWKP